MFGVPELLESIFLVIAIKDLLSNANGVCQQWLAMIETSMKLQRALFFQSVGSKRLLSVLYGTRAHSITRIEEHKDDTRDHMVLKNLS